MKCCMALPACEGMGTGGMSKDQHRRGSKLLLSKPASVRSSARPTSLQRQSQSPLVPSRPSNQRETYNVSVLLYPSQQKSCKPQKADSTRPQPPKLIAPHINSTHLRKPLDLGHHDAYILGLIHVARASMVDFIVGVDDQAMDAIPVKIHNCAKWFRPWMPV